MTHNPFYRKIVALSRIPADLFKDQKKRLTRNLETVTL